MKDFPMSQTPRVQAFAGSTRKDSFNKKLVQIAATGAREAGEAGAKVTVIDLKELKWSIANVSEKGIWGWITAATSVSCLNSKSRC